METVKVPREWGEGEVGMQPGRGPVEILCTRCGHDEMDHIVDMDDYAYCVGGAVVMPSGVPVVCRCPGFKE